MFVSYPRKDALSLPNTNGKTATAGDDTASGICSNWLNEARARNPLLYGSLV
jgi:hypothetical protein